jgi:ATP-dependent protease HslVU (ClpYQ) peptidase subunit
MGINLSKSKTMFIYPKNDKLFIASIDILKDEKTNSYIRIKKEIPVVLNDIESLQFIDSENIILSCRNSGNYDLYLLNIQL